MKFVMTQSICPEGIEKLKADTNGQVEKLHIQWRSLDSALG